MKILLLLSACGCSPIFSSVCTRSKVNQSYPAVCIDSQGIPLIQIWPLTLCRLIYFCASSLFNRTRCVSPTARGHQEQPRALKIKRARFIVAGGGGGWPFSATVYVHCMPSIIGFTCGSSTSGSISRIVHIGHCMALTFHRGKGGGRVQLPVAQWMPEKSVTNKLHAWWCNWDLQCQCYTWMSSS